MNVAPSSTGQTGHSSLDIGLTPAPAAECLAEGIADWIRCESPSHCVPALEQMATLIETDARSLGLQVERRQLDARTGPALLIRNVTAQTQVVDASSQLLILGHYDTVHPVGTLESNPCRIDDGRLYGPGSYDMKAGVYLALLALARVRHSSRLPVELLLVPDEEIGSRYSRALIEERARLARLALVAEPARAHVGRCVTSRKGTGLIRLQVRGRPSHAGVAHQQGRSAIRELAHQILALEALTDYARGITVNVGTIEGGTTTNVVPAHAGAVADVRIPDAQAAEQLRQSLAALRSVDPDVSVDCTLTLNRPPMPRTAAQAAIFERARALAADIGFDLQEAPTTGGGSDANFTAALGVPTLDGIGADGDGAHTLDEHVQVATLPTRLALWERLLTGLD